MRSLFVVLAAFFFLPALGSAQDPDDTRMLSQPAVSAEHIAFVYDGDVWLANRDGSGARRLTSHPGSEGAPRFSPDGSMLAFTAEYDGNADVFVVSAKGGAPTRLTWHPSPDVVRDWTPDGSVLFMSQRDVFTNRFTQLFTVPVEGTQPQALPIPNAFKAAVSPSGDRIAYTPLGEAMNQWKNYRGGRTSRIWLYDRDDHQVVEVPQPEGRSNDTDPMWMGSTIYFTSDRNGEFNLFAFDEPSGQATQLTGYDDFPVLNASAGAGVIIYEQAGYLHTFDPASGEDTRLRVAAPADLQETRARWTDGDQSVRNAHISPSGARAVFEFRGDIITVPAEKGDHRAITSSSDAHDRSPVWSPDGASIAFFSDASGEYQLHVTPQDGKGEARFFDVEGAGFYEDPKWSPDGKYISYSDNSWSLYVLELESGRSTKVAQEQQYGPLKRVHHSWSPDSRWIAYTMSTLTYFGQVFLYDVEAGESHQVTDGLSDVWEPVFDASGKYLYFFASTDAGPSQQWFAMSNLDMELTGTLYLAVLQSGEESPLKKETDEETVSGPEAEEESADQEEGEEGEEDESPRVVVDFEDLDQRILTLPVGNGVFSSLQSGADGQLYYLRHRALGFGVQGGPSLRRFDLGEREEETLAEAATAFAVSNDHKKILVSTGESWHIAPAGKVDLSTTRISREDLQTRVDPKAEWRQILREAWRIQRDFFYDPDMHGADWNAMWTKYEAFLPHLATRSDLNRVLQWMLSELAVGHSNTGGGENIRDAESVPGGLLGADYSVENGRYRFAKIYGGLNWNPELRAPLTEPGVEVQEGEYLLAVNGTELRAPDNLFRHFENSTGKAVELTIGPDADGSRSRTVTVVPIASDYGLRNRDWVEGNIRKVHEATDGRVAYVWVPNTSVAGWQYFKRYFYPQAHLDAIIVDERFNGGGSLGDYVIDILRRPYEAHWATRYGDDIRTPIAFMPGPKVMLIDETAGSGGDFLPWLFRQNDLGPLIGRRTWGGLVGMLGFPVLMDGGSVTAPNLGFWTENEGFGIENVGVPPDIEVEQWPAEVIAGHDPQLERAIEEVMRALRENPPHEYRRPPFPIRVRR